MGILCHFTVRSISIWTVAQFSSV
uniref:Uncharacterized protein n=1 Tax=Anguilla anguilla TaxID=7936 RepID=A0A0E9V154_ANGAN